MIGVVRDSGDSGASLWRMIAEEEVLTAAKAEVKKRAVGEGCGARGKLTRQGNGVIRPGRLLARECGKLERIVKIVLLRFRLLEIKRNRVEELLRGTADGDRKKRLKGLLKRLEEGEKELNKCGEEATRNFIVLGC